MHRALACTIAVLVAALPMVSASGAADSKPSRQAAYAEAGPHPVGFTTLHQADGRRVVVWYPARRVQAKPSDRQTLDLLELVQSARAGDVPAGTLKTLRADAFANLPVAKLERRAPLVLFGHGYGGFPEQTFTLTTHLASWGFVVAAPEHVERSGSGVFGPGAQGIPPKTDLEVLQATIDLMVDASDAPGKFHDVIDPKRIVATGESQGANAVYQLASADPRVDAWIAAAVAFGGQAGPAPSTPSTPGMVMLASADGIIDPATTKAVYEGMRTPKYLVEVVGAGHEEFSNLCLWATSDTSFEVLGEVGVIPPYLVPLAEDGCFSPHPPVEEAFPAIHHLNVAFFRSVLGIDKRPVGLTTDAVAGLGTPVTVTRG